MANEDILEFLQEKIDDDAHASSPRDIAPGQATTNVTQAKRHTDLSREPKADIDWHRLDEQDRMRCLSMCAISLNPT